MIPKRSVKMIESSEKGKRQLAFELQNSHVCEKHSNKSHQKRLNYEKEVMFCYICQKSRTNPFAAADGCTNRTPTLQRHIDCKEHEDVINEEAMRDAFNKAQSQAILTAMRAIYWLAKEDIATVKYNSLLNFLDEVGLKSVKNLQVAGNATYQSHQSAEGMQDAIAIVLKSNIDKQVEASLFFSL